MPKMEAYMGGIASVLYGGIVYPLLHVRGATAPIEHVRTTPIMKLILPPGPETSRPAAALGGTQLSSPALSRARFRFGLL